MTVDDWRAVLTSAAVAGVEAVQFIGGEPTLHPDCAGLVRHALALNLKVEVYTNLVRVSESWWTLFQHPRVSVGTAYYTGDSAAHDAFTRLRGSHVRTRNNIATAVRRGVRLRVGVIDIGAGTEAACADLLALGVTNVQVSPVQKVGRAADGSSSTIADLCGSCGQGRAAIRPNGDVSPCTIGRWILVGNVRQEPLEKILEGPQLSAIAAELRSAFRDQARVRCRPDGDCLP